jgi:lipoyl-dependent peroxiredoxin
MARPVYTAEATVSGGRLQGHGRSSDGELDVQLRPPNEGGGTNPEQLFAVGYAACFESALRAIGRRERVDLGEVSIDSLVSLLAGDDRTYELGVELHVSLPTVGDVAAAKRYVAEAHRVCPYSNAIRGNVAVTLTVNGEIVS